MKFLGQTKDGVIDNLLRAYVSRPTSPHQACPEFDPDRASAYVERSLPSAARLQFEAHLSECAGCRTNVVALVRLAQADTVAPRSPAREVARSTWFSGAKQMFGALSQPQWAMAVAAVIVLGISLPLLLSRNQARDASLAIEESDNPQSAAAAASPSASPKSGEAAPALAATSKQRENSDEKTEVLARNAPAASKPADAASGIEAGADLSKKAETRNASLSDDEAQRKSQGQLSQAPAQAGAAPGSQVAKNDSDQNRQQQPEKDAAQQAGEPKVARGDEERAKEVKDKTERAEDVAAPPPAAPSSEVAKGRAGLRRPEKLSLRDSTGEAVRPEERKFSGKKFLFRDGAWTDKDFDPNKDLPVVTIIRDSNVYKEVLSKRAGLRSIMERFTSTERAIIVYKGTVYKLIPQ